MTDVLVVAEHRNGSIRSVTAEAVRVAADIATGEVAVVLVAPDPDALIDELALAEVGTVYTASYDEPFNHDVYTQVVCDLVAELDPSLVVAGNTVNGLDYLPAVATRLDWPLATDVTTLDRSADSLTVVREAYSSKVESTIDIQQARAVVSIRPGEWEAVTAGSAPTVEPAPVSIDDAIRSVVTAIETAEAGDVDITDADVIVSIGRGIGDEENLSLIEDLADALGATVAASRPIVDAGWLPKNRQVGQSGKTVTPRIYLAIGISGAVQHVAGMKGAETIVAINEDPDAPIFEIADVGIVDDLFEVVPALIDAFDS